MLRFASALSLAAGALAFGGTDDLLSCDPHGMAAEESFGISRCNDVMTSLDCAGDDLGSGSQGWFHSAASGADVEVDVSTDHAYNLYEVYYEEDVQLLGTYFYAGYFITDDVGRGAVKVASGDPTSWAAYQAETDMVDLAELVAAGAGSEGHFTFYSRGPAAWDDGTGGVCYNTVNAECDTDDTAAFANPEIVERSGVQFISCSW